MIYTYNHNFAYLHCVILENCINSIERVLEKIFLEFYNKICNSVNRFYWSYCLFFYFHFASF